MSVLKMSELSLSGKRVLIREDLNVPIKNGVVSSDKRIQAALPSIKMAIDAGAKVLLMSHLGRPTEGQWEAEYSLQPVADYLSDALGQNVPLVKDYLDNAPQVADGQVVLLENVRFNAGEKKDDEALAKQYASLCDVFVMDAFGTAHRAQASTHGVGLHAATACAGPLLVAELDALAAVMDNPARPLLAIVGGSKVSTKLTVLESLSGVVDQMIVGGGIANTFIAAQGHGVGKSLYEADLQNEATKLKAAAQARGGDIPVPTDVVTGKAFAEDAAAETKSVAEVAEDDLILDVGPETARAYAELIEKAGTIVWNGPVGVFEYDQFGGGTKALGDAIAASAGFSVAGGGDTLAAVAKYGIEEKISYISTGGGAFLEFLEGKKLPAVAMLEKRAADA